MTVHNIVIAGCGSMAHVWMDYVQSRKDIKVVGLVDINEETAHSFAEKYNLNVPAFLNLSEALDKVEATIVFDITTPSSHKDTVITALRSGCHVFGEKPMAESLSDVKEILSVVKETGKKYSVMQNRRYLKHVRSIKQFLSSRRIGTVGSVHANFFLGPHFGGFREVMDHPLILDMAIHTFDQARFMIDAKPISAYCHEYNPPGSWYKGNASAICIFEMDNGAVFTYNGSWCAEGFNTSWESEWRITGSKGSVVWNGFDDPICEVVEDAKHDEFIKTKEKIDIPTVWTGQEGHHGCLDEMFASIVENRIAETDSSDNYHSIAMVFGAIESMKLGKKVIL